MNARSQAYSIWVEVGQLEEAVSAFLHSLLLHRSLGKLDYHSERNYRIGNLGTEDVHCNSIDLTYLRLASPALSRSLSEETRGFKEAFSASPTAATLAASPTTPTGVTGSGGAISLEFYQKRRRQWPLPEDVVPWEVWRLDCRPLASQTPTERRKQKEALGEALSEIILDAAAHINRPAYQPKIPTATEVAAVFDPRFPDCQPYLYRLRFDCGGPESVSLPGSAGQHPVGSLGSTMKKLLKDTLSM